MIGFVTVTEADCCWYKWEAMPGQGSARKGCVTVDRAQKSPEADHCPGQAMAADHCPVTAVKGLAAENCPVKSHAPAPVLGTAMHAGLDCMTVSGALTVSATEDASVMLTVAPTATETVHASECLGSFLPLWLCDA